MHSRLLLAAGLMGLLVSTSFALMGPPTAELKEGQWSVGYSYTYSVQDLDKTEIKWAEYNEGVLDDSDTDKVNIKDVKTQRHYATVSYGLADWWEIYASVGIADVKAEYQWEGEEKHGANLDNDFAWGWGTKITFARQDTVAWGVAVQMNFLDTGGSEKGVDSDGPWKDEINFETLDMLVAVGPTIDMGGWKLYGGPFYYLLDGEHTGKSSWVEDGDNWTAEESGDLEADSNFGGYVGAQFGLAENCDMTTEFALTGDGWGLGAGIAWKF